MSEKPSQFERPPVRVVGESSEKTKEKLKQKISARFRNGEFTDFSKSTLESFKRLEYDKRPYEIEFIEASLRKLNSIREKYGLEPVNVSLKNFHIVTPEMFQKAGGRTDGVGIQDSGRQITAVNSEKFRKSISQSGRTTLHELTHLLGYVAFETRDKPKEKEEEDPDWKWSEYRVGLVTCGTYKKADKDKFYESFRGLNEAVVSEIEDRHANEIVTSSQDPAVLEELEWLASPEASEIRKNISEKHHIPESEILWVNKNREAEDAGLQKSYRSQRKVLHFLVEQIEEDTGKDREEVLDTFFKAHFTGNLVDITRMINNIFDDEFAFRILGMMGGEIKDGRQMLDYLEKKRTSVKKKRRNKSNEENQN